MKRIAIVGAGNAGCITALELLNIPDLHEITIYHSPEEHPIEKVGQGTLPGFMKDGVKNKIKYFTSFVLTVVQHHILFLRSYQT